MRSFLERRRWPMLVAATLMKCIVFFPNGWAVFQPYVSQQLGYTADEAALAMPLIMVFFALFSIVGGRVQDRLSPRAAGLAGVGLMTLAFFSIPLARPGQPITLYVTYCLFYGAGYGLLYPAANTTLLKWYADRTGFAGGLSSSIAGLYLVAQTYAAEALLSRFSLSSVMAMFGAYSLAICLPACLFLVVPSSEYLEEKRSLAALRTVGAAPTGGREFTPGQMFRTPQFYLLFIAIVLATPAYMLLNPQLVSLCMNKGLTKDLALLAVSCGSVAVTVGQLVIPPLSDRLGRKPVLLGGVGLAILCALLFMLCNGAVLIFIWAGLSMAFNSLSNLIIAFVIDMFGFENSGVNSGLVNMAGGVGALAGPALLGLLTPLWGGNAIYLIGILGAAAGFVCMSLIDPDTAKAAV